MARKKRKTKVEKKPLFEDLTPHARQAIWAVVMGIIAVFFLFSLLDYAGPVGRFTETALQNIAETTLENIRDFERGKIKPERQVTEAFIK